MHAACRFYGGDPLIYMDQAGNTQYGTLSRSSPRRFIRLRWRRREVCVDYGVKYLGASISINMDERPALIPSHQGRVASGTSFSLFFEGYHPVLEHFHQVPHQFYSYQEDHLRGAPRGWARMRASVLNKLY